MVITHVVTHGLIYFVVVTGYLVFLMVAFSPRVWGYVDYPAVVKSKVPAQTRREKTVAAIVAVPWGIFVIGFPVLSTLLLKSRLGGEIPFTTALANVLVQFLLATIGDLVIIDWLIINTLTPAFVMIPGTTRDDYRDFSHHYKGHARAAVVMILLAILIAGLVSRF